MYPTMEINRRSLDLLTLILQSKEFITWLNPGLKCASYKERAKGFERVKGKIIGFVDTFVEDMA